MSIASIATSQRTATSQALIDLGQLIIFLSLFILTSRPSHTKL